MSSKRPKQDFSRFIDDEAADDGDDESDIGALPRPAMD